MGIRDVGRKNILVHNTSDIVLFKEQVTFTKFLDQSADCVHKLKSTVTLEEILDKVLYFEIKRKIFS